MSLGYGFTTHHVVRRFKGGYLPLIDCKQKNAQLASEDWAHVDCKRCLSHKPEEKPE